MTDSLERKALEELKEALKAQVQWTKVHAAEYLIRMGYAERVKKEFLRENDLYHTRPKYRIGIWRVLAKAETEPEQKNQWRRKILEAFSDQNGPDQLHAIETLAKLKLSPLAKCPEATQKALTSKDRNFNVYAIWATAYDSDQTLHSKRQELLNIAISDPGKIIRKAGAFGLRELGSFTSGQWVLLASKALMEPAESGLRNCLLNTAFVSFREESGETGTFRKIREEMLRGHEFFSFETRIDLALSLAERGTVAELPLLQSFLNNEGIPDKYEGGNMQATEIRTAAAFAILKIKQISGGRRG